MESPPAAAVVAGDVAANIASIRCAATLPSRERCKSSWSSDELRHCHLDPWASCLWQDRLQISSPSHAAGISKPRQLTSRHYTRIGIRACQV